MDDWAKMKDMEQKLIVAELYDRMITALTDDGRIAELHVSEKEPQAVRVGDIYIGRVKKIVKNIQAAFIEIRPGMECYYSMSGNLSPVFTHRAGKKPLCIGDELLVQVEREAVKTKTWTVTSKLSFTGRYAVVTTGNTACGVSAKIQGSLRDYWKEAVKEWQNDLFGVVIRTNAQETDPETVQAEIGMLAQEARLLSAKASARTCYSCMKQSPAPYLEIIKGLSGRTLSQIVVEDSRLYREIKEYLSEHQPELLEKLVHYQDASLSLVKLYSMEHVLKEALKEKVWMKSGGYLVIQPTEALTVIDVNSGKCVLKKKDAEGFLKLNLEAAREAARQIRLRNLSGIILIDFINLSETGQTQTLLDALTTELKKDSVKTEVVDVTKLQLVEITRKKVYRPLHEVVNEKTDQK